MTKEEKVAVKDVEVVLEVLKEYMNSKKDMPYEVLKDVVNKLKEIEEDYNKTINELLLSNALVVKFEQLIELIGTVGTISVEDDKKLDKTITILSNCVDAIKDWNVPTV